MARLAALLGAVVALGACGQAATPEGYAARVAASGPLCGLGLTTPSPVEHVVWILMENHSYPDVVGNRQEAPYLNDTVIPGCGLATDDHNVSHPSLPNYLALSAGTVSGDARNSDCGPDQCPQSAQSIYALLESAGREWRVYAQSMPSPCGRQNDGDYTTHHNPAVYYAGIRCRQWDLPMGTPSGGALASDLADDRLPALAVVVPDEANDMHSGPISSADYWLAQWLPAIVRTPSYRAGHTVVMLTWDEGEGGDDTDGEDCPARPVSAVSCWVPLVVISASTAPGTRLSTATNHYAVLRTTEELLGLAPLLGGAAGAPSLTGDFGL
jgi:phospholipase C